MSAFAADVSAALFASADAGDFPQVDAEPSDLGAALEAGGRAPRIGISTANALTSCRCCSSRRVTEGEDDEEKSL